MADERQRQLMQEALDQSLSPDLLQKLRQELDGDPSGSQQYNRLKRVDDMLRSAPYERAPARLALGIMAKLAQTMNPRQLSTSSSAAVALGLAMVVMVALPVLTVAISLFLSAMGSAAALNAILQQIANLLALVVAMLDALVQGAQSVLKNYPQAPLLILTVTPIILYWLIKAVEGENDNGEQGELGMSRLDNRTLALGVILAFIVLLILNPNGLMYTLNVLQTLVIIVLGIVATMYLWKRM